MSKLFSSFICFFRFFKFFLCCKLLSNTVEGYKVPWADSYPTSSGILELQRASWWDTKAGFKAAMNGNRLALYFPAWCFVSCIPTGLRLIPTITPYYKVWNSALPLFTVLTRFNASQKGGWFYNKMEIWDPWFLWQIFSGTNMTDEIYKEVCCNSQSSRV